MAEYISREITLDTIRELSQRYNDESLATFAYDIVTKIPAADVQPVKRGKWKWNEKPAFGNPYGSYICSECGAQANYQENYCCECGAKMRGEDNG